MCISQLFPSFDGALYARIDYLTWHRKLNRTVTHITGSLKLFSLCADNYSMFFMIMFLPAMCYVKIEFIMKGYDPLPFYFSITVYIYGA